MKKIASCSHPEIFSMVLVKNRKVMSGGHGLFDAVCSKTLRFLLVLTKLTIGPFTPLHRMCLCVFLCACLKRLQSKGQLWITASQWVHGINYPCSSSLACHTRFSTCCLHIEDSGHSGMFADEPRMPLIAVPDLCSHGCMYSMSRNTVYLINIASHLKYFLLSIYWVEQINATKKFFFSQIVSLPKSKRKRMKRGLHNYQS